MRNGQRSGPPTWFVILLGIAIVFGLYYLWLGVRNFMSSGASVVESTRQAIVQNTATAVRIQELKNQRADSASQLYTRTALSRIRRYRARSHRSVRTDDH